MKKAMYRDVDVDVHKCGILVTVHLRDKDGKFIADAERYYWLTGSCSLRRAQELQYMAFVQFWNAPVKTSKKVKMDKEG